MFEYVGRVDQQVKIRGFRVELGEVESHLNRISGVQDAAVVLRTDNEGHSVLVAFYSSSEAAALSGEGISERLTRVLPDYMIPARFEPVRELPLTPNHKVDRKFLGSAAWDEIFARCRHESVSFNSRPERLKAIEPGVVQQTVKRIAAEVLKQPVTEMDWDRPLVELGFDSIRFTSLAVALSRQFSQELDATIFYQHKTIGGVAKFLTNRISPSSGLGAPATRSSSSEPIAIIGMAARLPDAPDVNAFWDNLSSGRDAIHECPQERLGDHWTGPIPVGGFIDDVDKFDAPFFGISPREATAMDPRQRIFLESVWHAIEDSGQNPGELAGSNTGVFVGIVGGAEYHGQPADETVDSAAQLLLGSASSLIANRVSYYFDFRGPSAPIDTACSSSLVTLHRAVVALQSGECELAVAGGINLLLDPELNRAGAKTGMLSATGRCKTFDEDADGYVRGEGVVTLLLKPLSRAEQDGDPIHAVILGSAENHGGRAAGLAVPNPEAQSEVVTAALRKAGVQAETISYIETHGTGTQLGDPIEVNALKSVFCRAPAEPQRGGHHCGLGSVKTNIGHLEAAAGLAGLLKVILAFRHHILPRNLHFHSLNPKIGLTGTPFFILDRNQAWPAPWEHSNGNLPRRAGVSSFGFSG